MTLDQLNQYRDQQRELAELERCINETVKSPLRLAFDTVKSAANFPYKQHVVTVRGIDESARRRHARLIARYRRRKAKLEQGLEEVERWIDTIEDSKLRQIITMRFIKGKSWRRVAAEVYGAPSFEDAARKRVERFLNKSS